MARILVWRNERDRPYSAMVLANGDRVDLALDAGGLQISRIDGEGRRGEVLFRSDAETASRICHALLAGRPPDRSTPLDLLTNVVNGIDSAAEVRSAFQTAAAALPRNRRVFGGRPFKRPLTVAVWLASASAATLLAWTMWQSPPAASARQPIAGDPLGGALVSIRDQVTRCWRAPEGDWGDKITRVRIRVTLALDGSISEVPVIVDHQRLQDTEFRSLAEQAVRAVRECAPFQGLAPADHELWRSVQVTFFPDSQPSILPAEPRP